MTLRRSLAFILLLAPACSVPTKHQPPPQGILAVLCGPLGLELQHPHDTDSLLAAFPTSGRSVVTFEVVQLDDERVEYVVLETDLPDDSTEAQKTRLVFTRKDSGELQVAEVACTHRCQQGRGHQEFSTEPCL